MLSVSFLRHLAWYGFLVAGVNAKAWEGAEAALKFTHCGVDVGFIPATNIVSRSFPFEVTGKKGVSILQTAANCGCAIVSAERTEYQPGEKGSVHLDINPRGLVGLFRKEAYIKDSSGRLHILEVRGIAPGIKDIGSKASFGPVPRGLAITNHCQLAAYVPRTVAQPVVISDAPENSLSKVCGNVS